MDYTTNLLKLYAFHFFSSLIPAYVIERLYWEERGMTIQMVVYTEIIFAVTIVLLEIPTGIMADKWGRKKMLLLSALLGCTEFLLLLYATAFWHFALVVFLAGISRSAASGSENALLYDSLKLQGQEATFEKQLGRLNACGFLSAILAALSGSMLANRFGLELNYWISLGSALIALCFSIWLVEPDIAGIRPGASADGDCSHRAAEAEPTDNCSPAAGDIPISFKQYAAASLRFFRSDPGVCAVVLSGMVTGSAMGYIEEFWQLYASRLGLPVVYFGMLSAAIMLLQLPGNLLAHVLLRRFSYRTLIVGSTAIFTAGFTCIAGSRDTIGLAAMLTICLCSGLMVPLTTGYLHHRTESSMRATIASFQSLGENLVHMLAGLGFGYLSSRHDVFGGYGFLAFLCLVFLVWFVIASPKIEH
jgi:MFS family permease